MSGGAGSCTAVVVYVSVKAGTLPDSRALPQLGNPSGARSPIKRWGFPASVHGGRQAWLRDYWQVNVLSSWYDPVILRIKMHRNRGGVEGLGFVRGTSYTSNRNLEPGMEEAFQKATLDNARNSVQETLTSQTPNLKPQTRNAKPRTPNPKPQTPDHVKSGT